MIVAAQSNPTSTALALIAVGAIGIVLHLALPAWLRSNWETHHEKKWEAILPKQVRGKLGDRFSDLEVHAALFGLSPDQMWSLIWWSGFLIFAHVAGGGLIALVHVQMTATK